ncbi:14085_t:CDS:2, partial [Racocetra persica]
KLKNEIDILKEKQEKEVSVLREKQEKEVSVLRERQEVLREKQNGLRNKFIAILEGLRDVNHVYNTNWGAILNKDQIVIPKIEKRT